MISLRIPAVPVAQPRAKASAFGGKARMYTPTTLKATDGTKKAHPIVAFKATVRMACEEKYTGPPLEGPLRVDCCFVLPRPKRLLRKKDPDGRMPHDAKPDRDNLDKAVMDALSGLLWGDDRQASVGLIEKWWAAKDEGPHVLLKIQTWSEELREWQ